MQDFGGFRIQDLPRFCTDEATLDLVLADLREWVDINSEVTAPVGGPTGTIMAIIQADDLLLVAPDRRDVCFAGVRNFALNLMRLGDPDVTPADIRKNLRSNGVPLIQSWLLSRLLPKLGRVEGGPIIWCDDGIDATTIRPTIVKPSGTDQDERRDQRVAAVP